MRPIVPSQKWVSSRLGTFGLEVRSEKDTQKLNYKLNTSEYIVQNWQTGGHPQKCERGSSRLGTFSLEVRTEKDTQKLKYKLNTKFRTGKPVGTLTYCTHTLTNIWLKL